MTTKLSKILKTIFIVLLYFLFDSLFIYLIEYLKIDYINLSINYKILLMILCDLLLMLILYLIFHKDINNDIKDYKNNFQSYFSFGLRWWMIGITIMFISNLVISYFVPSGATNEILVEQAINKLPWYMFFSSVIYAPFVEEIVFRKNVREMFPNDFIYVLISSLLFGFIHIISATTKLELLFIVPYGALGAIFAYIYTKTKNIFVPITFHMIHNFIIVSIYILRLYIGV